MSEVPIAVYAAGEAFGARDSWRRIVSDAWAARTLVWYLAGRDFKTQYKQSLFGYGTALGPPLMMVAFLTLMAQRRLLPIGDTQLPYPVFALLGLSIWGLFAGVVGAVTGSLSAASSLVKKMDFPREAVVFSAPCRPFVDTLIRGAALVVLLIVFGVVPKPAVLLLPLVVVPLVLLAVGVGFFLAVLNALARDVSTGVSMALQLGMLLSPVIYPPPTAWPFVLVNYVNPVSPFVIAAQDLMSRGYLTMPAPLAASSLLGVLTFLIGWRVFRLAQPIVVERM